MSNKSKYLYNKRKSRTRFRLKNSCTKSIRLSVFRSNSNIYAQIIDDKKHSTLLASSSLDKDLKKIIGNDRFLQLKTALLNLGSSLKQLKLKLFVALHTVAQQHF